MTARRYILSCGPGDPNGISTDDSAPDDAIKGILNGFNQATANSGGFAVAATPGRSLKVTGYTGRQYALDLGPVSGVVRVLSKQIGDERELFFLCAMSAVDNESLGSDFFDSFKATVGAVGQTEKSNEDCD